MTVANSKEVPSSDSMKTRVCSSRQEVDAFIAKCKAETGISYEVTIYPAAATDARIPVSQSWSGNQSYTVVAQGTVD